MMSLKVVNYDPEEGGKGAGNGSHKGKDQVKDQEKVCQRCIKAKAQCRWEIGDGNGNGDVGVNGDESDSIHQKRQYDDDNDDELSKKQKIIMKLSKDEHLYANVLQSSRATSQFISATQPLAPILSRDSVLSLDGEVLGLFCPWRNDYFEPRDKDEFKIDKELKSYLNKKGAFIIPQISEQRRLIKLFLDNVYPLYPVVNRNILENLQNEPLLLINSMMLAGVKYDPFLQNYDYRIRSEEFKSRCKYLQMIETNKVTLIQSYLLLSINEEGPEGANCAREYISKAILLIMELGLPTLAVAEHFDVMKTDKSDIKTMFRLNSDRNLMVRLFWTSYCCDRIAAATSCSAMLYNIDDLIIEEPFLKNFDDFENYQISDYELFKRWYSLNLLFERVIKTVYRPPGRRTLNDSNLELDLLNWGIRNLNATLPIESKFMRFLKVSHAYCNLLYLRCKIGLLDLIESNNINKPVFHSNESPLSTAGMYYVYIFSNDIIESLKFSFNNDCIEHILNVHSTLHVLVLIHLEIESKKLQTSLGTNGQSTTTQTKPALSKDQIHTLKEKENQYNQCLELLKNFKNKYWFAAASFNLFEKLNSIEPQPKEIFENLFNNQQDLNQADNLERIDLFNYEARPGNDFSSAFTAFYKPLDGDQGDYLPQKFAELKQELLQNPETVVD
ncbi:Transcriptional activator protein [Wickerhamomyces ciferrii]|uniref:Transcriptional activator protein n=1 Tax=Wickerhamomyces ciferrii (strain ATCC 14091 / BCRC 22168 / CBS 111 / JCM 3599 / NBRC 0793 / NRRL Y-1031 F-60-10) TaxID=1206466 RepID=K0KVU8_WICCF|nr:Transcriptional activator protein [Wickerhamomyces ciferrii]CCH46092.1 Transcriptional activator protein [Wickerhamomyces ciferrii]